MSYASGNRIYIVGLLTVLAILAGKISAEQAIQITQNVAPVQTSTNEIKPADRRMSLEDFFLNRNSQQQVGAPDQQVAYDQPIAGAQQSNPNSVVFVRDANIPNAAGNIVSRLILARRMLRLTRLMRRLRIVPRIFGLGLRRPLRQATQAGGPLSVLTNRIGEAYNGEYDPRDFVFGSKGFNYNNTKDIFEKGQTDSQENPHSYSQENNPSYQNQAGGNLYNSQPQTSYSSQPPSPLGYAPTGIKSVNENFGKPSSDINLSEQNNLKNLQQYHQLLKNLQQLQELQQSFYSPDKNAKVNTQLENKPNESLSPQQNNRQPQYQSEQELLDDFYLDKPLSADELQQLQFLNDMLSRMTREQQIQLIHQIQQYRDQQLQQLQDHKFKQQLQQLQEQQIKQQEALKAKLAQQQVSSGTQQGNQGYSYEQPQLQNIQQIIDFNQQNNNPFQNPVSFLNHQHKLQDIQSSNWGYSNPQTQQSHKPSIDDHQQSIHAEEKNVPTLGYQNQGTPQLQHAHQGISNEHLQNSIKSLIDFHQQAHQPNQNQFTLSNQHQNVFQGPQSNQQVLSNQQHHGFQGQSQPIQQTIHNQQHQQVQGSQQPLQQTLTDKQHEELEKLEKSIQQLLSNQQHNGLQGLQQPSQDQLYQQQLQNIKQLINYNQQQHDNRKKGQENEISHEINGKLYDGPQGKDLGPVSLAAGSGTPLTAGGNVIGVGVNVGIKPAVDVAVTKPVAASIQSLPQLHNPIAVKPLSVPPIVPGLVPVGFLPKPILNLNGRLFLGAEMGKDVKLNAGIGR